MLKAMVEEAKKGQLWSHDEFIQVRNMASNATERLNKIKSLVEFWDTKKDTLQRLIVKKNVPFK